MAAQSNFYSVISVRPEDSQIDFYSSVGRDKNNLKLDTKNYKARFNDEEFYQEFARCLREYAMSNPSYAGKSSFVTVILPDWLISTSTFNIPGVNRKSTENLFKVSYEGTFKNNREFKMNQLTVMQNKQYATIAVAVIRQKLMQDIYTACSGSNMFASILTSRSNCIVSGALQLNNKLKNETFILLDIRESASKIIYTTKGVTLGCIDLPFGSSILRETKPVAENMLFNHPVAELAVINAKEKAKAKQLTIAAGEEQTLEGEEGGEDVSLFDETPAQQSARTITQTVKVLPKKTPRNLPKWMQRPIPETPEGVAAENFRIFVKYVLEFIRGNERLTTIAQPGAVYVNMPEDLIYLIDEANKEEAENKIKFASLGLNREKPQIKDHLELYGGLFASQFSSLNNF